MSELINNNKKRKELLKHMILKLHEGETADAVKQQLTRLLGKVPYGVVVEAEQELISEGLPSEEVLKLCDIHGKALKGVVDPAGAPEAPPGHPVHTFKEENKALDIVLEKLQLLFIEIEQTPEEEKVERQLNEIHQHFNSIMDVDKHYRRKENLLFPYLEKYEITGPPTVMWGKDDEIRELLKSAIESLSATKDVTGSDARTLIEMILKPAAEGVAEMIYKEEEILFPMCLDTLTDLEWYEIYKQSDEIGYCLVDPREEWKPENIEETRQQKTDSGKIQLPTGSFTLDELKSIFDTLPVDITFVDEKDTVRFFSEGTERIFDRNRAILGRKVQMCHPPSSVHIVQQIIDDFRTGKENSAAFWINLKGKFIHIRYFALRNDLGDYLGTVEMTQDLTELRALEGEQRLLNYQSDKGKNHD